jgi:hypothetical protein
MEPAAEGGNSGVRNGFPPLSCICLASGLGGAAVVAQQFRHQRDAFATFGTAAAGGIHILGALALARGDSVFELAVG